METNLCLWRSSNTFTPPHLDDPEKISTLSDLPWLCMGDFNEVLRPNEHEGIGQRSNAQIQAFRDTIDVCMLLDLGYKGRFWTFQKKVTGGSYTWCRLDRALVNVDWMVRLPLASVTHEVATTSHHAAVLVDWGRTKEGQKVCEFKKDFMTR